MRTEPPLRTFLRTFVSTNGRRRPSYAPFFYFGVLFIAREGKCGAKRREKFDCWACQHQFLVNNNHSKARCTQELLLLRLKSLLLLCVLAGWFLQERKEREANEQQQREAPRKIPRCVSCVTSISGRTTSKQSTTSAKRNMTSCLDRMTSSKQSTTSSKPSTTSSKPSTTSSKPSMLIAICEQKLFLFFCLPSGGAVGGGGGGRRRPSYAHGGLVMRPRRGRDAP